ncbi:MAG: hypothetical protein ABIQ06_08700 [Caldimonas sp.]
MTESVLFCAWSSTSFGRFYPDFVCELLDGRILVAEYKGEQIRTMTKEIEKDQVGRRWAEWSAGRCCFVTLYKTSGMSLAQQLEVALV